MATLDIQQNGKGKVCFIMELDAIKCVGKVHIYCIHVEKV
jgi:hypothetical protein